MTKKPCPQCVIDAGGALVKARHATKSSADAEKVGSEFDKVDWDGLRAAIDTAMTALKDFGVMQMEFGPGLLHLSQAQHGPMWERYPHLLCAHNEFRQVLDRYDVANPTDKQIATAIGLANWR